jgi:hypothetical protein
MVTGSVKIHTINMNYFVFTYTGKPIGESGESCGTTYKLDTGCNLCGTGVLLAGNLKTTKISSTGHDIFQTIDGDYIISEKLHNEILNENIDIGNLKNIVGLKGSKLPFYHLVSELSLPKVSKANGLIIEGQCMNCRRNGYFNDLIMGNLEKKIPTRIVPLELVYDKMDAPLFNQRDIISSWEHIGLSSREAKGNRVIRYARPLLIVSDRLKNFLEKRKLRNLKFEPIKILE